MQTNLGREMEEEKSQRLLLMMGRKTRGQKTKQNNQEAKRDRAECLHAIKTSKLKKMVINQTVNMFSVIT